MQLKQLLELITSDTNILVVLNNDSVIKPCDYPKYKGLKIVKLKLVQIAKRQNIPYGKLYHTYLVLGSLSEAIKVCRKG